MPAYNAERFVREAIESVLAQTFRDFELLFLDDGSTDQTASLAQEWARKDPRIRFLQRTHRGLVPILNEACELAQGSYIARLDADDAAFPDRLERQVAFLDDNPQVALLGGAMRLMNAEGKHVRDAIPPLEYSMLRDELGRYNCFFHSSVMFRKSVWQSLRGYRQTLLHSEDYDLWLRMAENHEVRNLPWFMGRYRMHTGQISRLQREQQVISSYVARTAAEIRKSGRPDPCDGVDLATRDLAIQIGVPEELINAAILEGHVKMAYSSCLNLRPGDFVMSVYGAARYFLKHGGRLRRSATARYKPKM